MGGVVIPDRDANGRTIVRTAATLAGWHYMAQFFKLETSTGNLVCKDSSGNDISSDFHVKRIDSNGAITTDKTQAVKTIFTWKPDYDYEIISGNIKQKTKAAQELLLHVTGGMYNEASNFDVIPGASGSFVQSMDLSFFEETKTDGRASKYMHKTTEGAPFSTNRFQYTFEHPAGFEHEVLISVEIFKA